MRISQSLQVALGRAIRLRREEVGLTLEALADAANLDPTSIRGLERGVANPTWDVADRIARALGLAILGLAIHELAQRADELETADGPRTNGPSGYEPILGCRGGRGARALDSTAADSTKTRTRVSVE